MDNYSYLSNAENSVIDDLYAQYLRDPELVETGWRKFFEGFEFSKANFEKGEGISQDMHQEFKVINLINGYRSRGHLFTKTNPVRERRKYSPTLDIENFGLDKSDLNTVFQAGAEIGIGPETLSNIVSHLETTYCESIGIEYFYIRNPERREWIRNKIELKNRPKISKEDKKHILHKLNQATVFEQFLQKKYVGQKRFSLEGGESLIPALDALIEEGVTLGIEEFIMGMAHRGRLNVLANIFNKTYDAIFSEFEGVDYEDHLFDGDVKYHLGYSSITQTNKGEQVRLTLSPNPSHLEAVDPIVEGITRAKIDHHIKEKKKIVPILIHGDAAIAGQGIVYEVIQMADLDGYHTGGTIHIVINNQVGFTTNYKDARSSTYCTDVAKSTLCPVFHVNGDDVEEVVQTMKMALEYRQRFHRDVFIDLLCYRKYGHNEGDEPKFTQPKLYDIISKHPNPREIYKNQLLKEGAISDSEADEMEKSFNTMLQDRLNEAKQIEKSIVSDFLADTWKGYEYANANDFELSQETKFDIEKLKVLAEKMCTLPDGKKFFKKVGRLMADRKKMIASDRIDWGLAEMLAYASLLEEGYPIRLSGQDVERGTFSHRHAVVTTEDTEEKIITLNSLSENQARFRVYNSLLSEYGVLGFDYGYAMASPFGLTIWEAQFGDFNNGAQIIIDQFLSSAEDKWKSMNGLVMLLPHGYEGMGSEHSSARIERYLSLCAENNMQIVNATTPANFFHVLRRQLLRSFRKPLVVFTPKKLLRYPKAVSSLAELSEGRFKEIIDDETVEKNSIETVVFCSGKIYYELIEEREKLGISGFAFVRLEQLYPFPESQMDKLVESYDSAKRWVWLQEEPENMGPWSYILRVYRKISFELISRSASGSPASGSAKVFERRQKALFSSLFSSALVAK